MTRSIAVVGHGLTPKGKGWGYNIDRSDVVVRMWNYHWQTPKDYGRKYDYGMFEISKTELARFNRHNVRFPGLGWLAFNLQPFPG